MVVNKIFFYIILISQSWLTIGTFCAHICLPDHELIEIFSEEEKSEKEKELEEGQEKVKNYENQKEEIALEKLLFGHIIDYTHIIGRAHNEDTTPPPEFI